MEEDGKGAVDGLGAVRARSGREKGLPGVARRGPLTAGSAPLPPDHSGVLLHRGFQQPLQDGPFPHRCASGGSRQRLGSTGHVPAPGPSLGRTSRLRALDPQLKKQTNFLKIQESPLPFLHLKEGNEERNRSAPRPMGQLARSGERARTSRAVPGSGLEPADARERGGAGVAACRSASSRPPESGLTPGVGGLRRVRAPAPAPGTSAGTGRPWAAACEARAERAELADRLGNPRPPPLIRP